MEHVLTIVLTMAAGGFLTLCKLRFDAICKDLESKDSEFKQKTSELDSKLSTFSALEASQEKLRIELQNIKMRLK